MRTCRVIADADSVVGFRLAGLEAVAAASPEEAERLLRECLAAGSASIILVKQSYLERFSELTRRKLDKLSVPLVIPLPLTTVRGGEAASQDYILSLIRRAIGYQMKITRG
jgi:V/A-type H+-transporting ATPase subunit F